MIVVIKLTSCLNMHEFTNAKINPIQYFSLFQREKNFAPLESNQGPTA